MFKSTDQGHCIVVVVASIDRIFNIVNKRLKELPYSIKALYLMFSFLGVSNGPREHM